MIDIQILIWETFKQDSMSQCENTKLKKKWKFKIHIQTK